MSRMSQIFGNVVGLVVPICLSVGCQCLSPQHASDSGSVASGKTMNKSNKTFSQDVAYLRRYVDTVVIESGNAKVAVVPAYQGRVMTSSTGGESEPSFGWLNYETIAQGVLKGELAAGRLQEHIHVFGGEERFWLGPEGGQFGIYFPPGAAFEFDFWKTPAPIDTEPFRIVSQTSDQVALEHQFQVRNHAGFRFDVGVRRTVRLLSRESLQELLSIGAESPVEVVAYETVNELKNVGDTAWTHETGALSVWLLGMYKHSPETTVAIPVASGSSALLGPQVNDEYFGKVPAERLKVVDDVVYFRADGAYRSKIGVTPNRSLGVAGSYAAETETLNLVVYSQPKDHQGYVNSIWTVQEEPFVGDAINAYNDGAPEPGAAPLGPFYELETSSPAAFLAPGEVLTHSQRTIHIRGDRQALDGLSRRHLGVGLDAIEAAF